MGLAAPLKRSIISSALRGLEFEIIFFSAIGVAFFLFRGLSTSFRVVTSEL